MYRLVIRHVTPTWVRPIYLAMRVSIMMLAAANTLT